MTLPRGGSGSGSGVDQGEGAAALAIMASVAGCKVGGDQHDYTAVHRSDPQVQGYVVLDRASLSGTFGDTPFSLDTSTFPGWLDQGDGSVAIPGDSAGAPDGRVRGSGKLRRPGGVARYDGQDPFESHP